MSSFRESPWLSSLFIYKYEHIIIITNVKVFIARDHNYDHASCGRGGCGEGKEKNSCHAGRVQLYYFF